MAESEVNVIRKAEVESAASAVSEAVDPDSVAARQHPAAAPDPDPVPARPTAELCELRTVKRLLWAVVVLAGLAVLSVAATVFIPLAAALLLNFVFKPVVRRMEDWRVPPPLSAMLIMGTLFVVMAAGLGAATDSAQAWLGSLPQAAEELQEKFGEFRTPLRRMNEATEAIGDIAGAETGQSGTIDEPVKVQEVRRSGFPTTILNTTASIAAGLTITLVLAFFLLASGDLLLRQLVQSLAHLRDKKEAVEAVHDLELQVSSYLVTVSLINGGLALVVWGAMSLLGLPNAMWWGITAGVMNFVPYVGPLVALVAIFLAAVLAFDSVLQALIAPLVFVSLTSLEGYFVTPTILGRRLSLNPLILILWLVFWGWLWGIAGALLAVPLLICFKIVCDHIERLEPLSNLLSGYVRKAGEARDSEPAPCETA